MTTTQQQLAQARYLAAIAIATINNATTKVKK